MHISIRRFTLAAIATLSSFAISAPAIAQTGTSAHTATHHRVKHHTRHRAHRVSGIPQHNGGDRDADNNGGPNDGDGNV